MKKAFSLVELMVVIAIVALLAAVAVPTYKDYITRTKINNAMPLFSKLAEEGRAYFNKNGTFPTAYNLGYGTSATPWLVNSSITSQWSPNLNAVYINNWYSGTQYEVGLVFNMTNFSGYNSSSTTPPNVISGTGNFLFISLFINANSNGVITTQCTYRSDYGMTSTIAATYFPGNCQTASTVPGPAPT